MSGDTVERFRSLTLQEKRNALAKFLLHGMDDRRERPLSFGQEARWLLSESTDGAAVDNMSFAWRIDAVLDPTALEEALRRIVARHGALRSVFGKRDHLLVRRGLQDDEVKLGGCDLSDCGACVGAERVARDASAAFDLEIGPLFRVNLYKHSSSDFTLLLGAHHIVVDFWSLGILLRELSKTYVEILAGREPVPAPAGASYEEFVLRETKHVVGEHGITSLRYWGSKLGAGVDFVDLPLDRAYPVRRRYRGDQLGFWLSRKESEVLKMVAAKARCTLFVLLLSMFFVVLHSYTGQRALAVVVPTSMRDQPGFDSILGDFANHIVISVDVEMHMHFEQFLRLVSTQVISAMAHRLLPYSLVSDRVMVHGVPVGAVPFPVRFNMPAADTLQRARVSADTDWRDPRVTVPMGIAEATLEYIDRQVTATCDLHLGITETSDCLLGSAQFNTEVFDRRTIEGLIARLRSAGTVVSKNLAKPIGDISAGLLDTR